MAKTQTVLANDSESLATGAATQIFSDPVTREKLEGVAVLRVCDTHRSDGDWWDGLVEFVDEPGPYYPRRVYRGA